MADEVARRVEGALRADAFRRRLANSDMDEAEPIVRSTLRMVDPEIELLGIGEKPRGIVREIELHWRLGDRDEHIETIALPAAAES